MSQDFWRIDDRTGFKERARDTAKEARTGYIVADPDPRHPQEGMKTPPPRLRLPDPSPEPADAFLTSNQVSASDL